MLQVATEDRLVTKRRSPLARWLGVAFLVFALNIAVGEPWHLAPRTESPVILGVTFSCRQAQWLELDCRETLAALLDEVGVRHLRFSVYWDEVEPERGRFDFSAVEWMLEEARQRGASVVLTIGMKGVRRPEFYFPDWLRQEAEIPAYESPATVPLVAERTLVLVEETVRRFASDDVIEAWQVENEPFVRRADPDHLWWITRDLLEREIAVVRNTDPRGRPIIFTDDSSNIYDVGWRDNLSLPIDVMGTNYSFEKPLRPLNLLTLYINPYIAGGLAPVMGWQANSLHDLGIEYWVTEFQAEPWAEGVSIKDIEPSHRAFFSPDTMKKNINWAARGGADRIYLWGVEWWYYWKVKRGDDRFWEAGKEIFGGATESMAAER